MDDPAECNEYLTGEIVQTIEDATCLGSRVLLDTDYNAILMELSSDEWTKLFSAILTGSDIVYPEESHKLHWLWVRAVECAMTFCEHLKECIETDEDVRTALSTANRIAIGTVFAFAGTTAPENCLLCAGQQFDDVDYPLLVAILDPAFSNGDGTFNVPDLSQKFIMGLGDADFEIGDSGGEAEHTLTIAEMPSHNHAYDRANAVISAYGAGALNGVPSRSAQVTGNVGSGEPHNTLPPYVILQYYIVAK